MSQVIALYSKTEGYCAKTLRVEGKAVDISLVAINITISQSTSMMTNTPSFPVTANRISRNRDESKGFSIQVTY